MNAGRAADGGKDAEKASGMKHLFDHRLELEAALAGKRLLLMIDFDGTLTPIASTPAEAEIPADTRRQLERLSRSAACTVAIVSGRALGDVRDKTGIDRIIYVGSHGMEVDRPNEEVRHYSPLPSEGMMKRMRENLTAALAPFEGVLMEDKGYSLAVHYRMVRDEDRPRVKAIVHETVQRYGGEEKVALRPGTMVLEIGPPLNRDKGTIVGEFIKSETQRRGGEEPFAMYLGDDITDEDAFKAIRGRGWPVLVGTPRVSYAQYYLNDPREVHMLLRMFAERFAEAE